jgi:hypothetical protein
MKKSIYLLLFFTMQISSNLKASEKICQSTAGQMLSMNISNTIFQGEEEKPFNEMKKELNFDFLRLCKTENNSNDIISQMYNKCFKLIQEKIKSKESKIHFEKNCDIAFTAATYFIDGYDLGIKESKEKISDIAIERNSQSDVSITESSNKKKDPQ